jgi:hypothetical protein
MLEIKPHCEYCGIDLPNTSTEAMICSFECTFCSYCVQEKLHNVCPNCGGGFEKRPIRPKDMLEKYPASVVRFVKQPDLNQFTILLDKYKNIPAEKR